MSRERLHSILRDIEEEFLLSGENIDFAQLVGRYENGYLDLSGLGIKHLPIKSISKLSKRLHTLDLRVNNLQKIPDRIDLLKNLKLLDLSSNRLRELPKTMCQLQRLEILNLEDNKITELQKCICKIINLRRLDLYQNDINSLPVQLINLSNLKYLDIEYNKIEHLSNEIITWLAHIRMRNRAIIHR